MWHDGRCTWSGDDYEPGQHGDWEMVHRTVGYDIYGGTAGIGLFLAHLARATADQAVGATARGALRQAVWTVRHAAETPPTGLYDGVAGVALAAGRVGTILGDRELGAAADELAGPLAEAMADDPRAHGDDLVGGAAGSVAALVGLAAQLGRADLLEGARAAGDALLAGARRMGNGWSWPSGAVLGAQAPGLCGLAHGASGIAWALLELHAATGEAAYQHGASEAIRYERGWFDRLTCNWPDLRGWPADAESHSVFWCHGAIGIGLARLSEHRRSGSDRALAEAAAAIQAARGEAQRSAAASGDVGLDGNFSLCHGGAGVAELLLCAYQTLGHEEHLHAARRVADHAHAARRDGSPWRCGLPEGGEAPGLLLGLAGIGACHLRLCDPGLMPQLGLLGGVHVD